MKIDNEMVLKKEIAGNRKDGSPVVMLVTHGGLYAFFSKNEKGEVETLSMAPHKAIAAWMAEQKARDINWNTGFLKSESSGPLEDLSKNQQNLYVRLRNLLFSDTLIKNSEKSDYYIIYDTKAINIGIMHKDEIQQKLDSKEIYRESFVRNVNLNEPCEIISLHKEFSVE